MEIGLPQWVGASLHEASVVQVVPMALVISSSIITLHTNQVVLVKRYTAMG